MRVYISDKYGYTDYIFSVRKPKHEFSLMYWDLLTVFVCVCVWGGGGRGMEGSVCVCVCVCVRERERESLSLRKVC